MGREYSWWIMAIPRRAAATTVGRLPVGMLLGQRVGILYRHRQADPAHDRQVHHVVTHIGDLVRLQPQFRLQLAVGRQFVELALHEGALLAALVQAQLPVVGFFEEERKVQLARLIGVERHVWAQIADFARVTPIADEALLEPVTEVVELIDYRQACDPKGLAMVSSAALVMQ